MKLSIKELLPTKTNDYSGMEESFEAATGTSLTEVALAAPPVMARHESVSVIVPSFGGQHTLPILLGSLQCQREQNFEVIVVDDASPSPIQLKPASEWPFPIKLLRRNRNGGIAAARNSGLSCAEGRVAVFLDDDLRVPEGLTLTLALRQQLISDCVFIGFRENVNADRFFLEGGPNPRLENDWRCAVEVKPHMIDLTAAQTARLQIGAVISLLHDTRRFKDFGNGRVIAFWDLPNMVVGHSICLKRDDAIAAGGFPEKGFDTWGVEDLAFGARLISHGYYVVPALDWVSSHLIQEGRKTSRETERQTLRDALGAYLQFIERSIDDLPFPRRRLRRVSKRGAIERWECE